ncbi:MAG: amidase family protein, partial [Pseudomonadota bacterium]
MPAVDLTSLSAVDLAAAIRDGQQSCEDAVDAYLARIDQIDGEIEAWAFIDPDNARAQAKQADVARRAGRPIGPLHGVPVGVKDIIDTRGMSTENGTAMDAGRKPSKDAAVVARLRAAG